MDGINEVNETVVASDAPIAAPKTLSELADELEKARFNRATADANAAHHESVAKEAAIIEREAYKAFNDAVAAMKPKRKSPTPRAAKPDGEKKAKPESDKKAKTPAKK